MTTVLVETNRLRGLVQQITVLLDHATQAAFEATPSADRSAVEAVELDHLHAAARALVMNIERLSGPSGEATNASSRPFPDSPSPADRPVANIDVPALSISLSNPVGPGDGPDGTTPPACAGNDACGCSTARPS